MLTGCHDGLLDGKESAKATLISRRTTAFTCRAACNGVVSRKIKIAPRAGAALGSAATFTKSVAVAKTSLGRIGTTTAPANKKTISEIQKNKSRLMRIRLCLPLLCEFG
jgi:hypothetical protein